MTPSRFRRDRSDDQGANIDEGTWRGSWDVGSGPLCSRLHRRRATHDAVECSSVLRGELPMMSNGVLKAKPARSQAKKVEVKEAT
jgi:hypothetical protein